MDTTSQDSKPVVLPQLHRFFAGAWYALRRPQITGLALVILVVVLALLLVVPQQSPAAGSPAAGPDLWIANLPPFVQLWGEPLYLLGFASLLNSVWFWLPLAVLLLNSLVSLADYGPGAWRRQQQSIPPITWQHPLTRRAGHSLRLPESPDTFLAAIRESLRAKGFWIYEPAAEQEQRLVGAAWHRRTWLGPAGLYAGLILLVGAGVVSSQFLQTDSFTLWPAKVEKSRLIRGQFELAGGGMTGETSQVIYRREASNQPAVVRQLTWSLYQPAVIDGVLAWPAGTEAVVTVEARDAGGNLLRLMPAQKNLLPAERLSLSLTAPDSPLYFGIPAANLAVQVSPDSTSGQPGYNVEVRRGTELVQVSKTQAGESFEVEGLSITLTPGYALQVVAYSDPALPLYLLGLILVVGSGLAVLLRRPQQLWLIPEVKGRGGQLYVVLEQFGPIKDGAQLLENLLKVEILEVGKDGRREVGKDGA